MKIVFNRQGKKHVCSTCFRPFDWDENSWGVEIIKIEGVYHKSIEELVKLAEQPTVGTLNFDKEDDFKCVCNYRI